MSRLPESLLHQFEGLGDARPRLAHAGHGRMRMREQHEGEAVAMIRIVEDLLVPVVPFQLPRVAARVGVAMRLTQEAQAVACCGEPLRIAEAARRYREIEDEPGAADEVTRRAVVDGAVVLEVMKEAARRVETTTVIEGHRVEDVDTQKAGGPEVQMIMRRGGRHVTLHACRFGYRRG